MTTLTHPSEQFPTTPAVSVAIPQGWAQLSTPDTLLSAVQQVPSEADFSSNVVVRGGTRRAQDQVMDFVMELQRSLGGLTGLVLSEPSTVELSGVPFTLIEARFSDGRGVPVRQLHAVALLPRDGGADFVQVTGSCGGPAVETGFARVDAVVRSVQLAAAASAGGEGTIVHPSTEHPGVPTIALDVPEDWTSTTVPAIAMAVVKPREGVPVAPNVIVRTGTVPATQTLETLVADLRTTISGRLDPRFSELGSFEVDGGSDVTLVQLSWAEPEGPAIAQLHAMTLLARPDGLQDYVNVTGTVGRDDTEVYPEVERVVRSARVAR